MDLKDWNKLSQEEQQRLFDQRSPELPPMTKEALEYALEHNVGEIKLGDKMIEIPIGTGYTSHFPCPAGLIELRNNLKGEIADEAAAANKYILVAGKFAHFGMPALAEKARLMAAEELAHKHVLEAAVDITTTNCEE